VPEIENPGVEAAGGGKAEQPEKSGLPQMPPQLTRIESCRAQERGEDGQAGDRAYPGKRLTAGQPWVPCVEDLARDTGRTRVPAVAARG
jgi:hypothetical protein